MVNSDWKNVCWFGGMFVFFCEVVLISVVIIVNMKMLEYFSKMLCSGLGGVGVMVIVYMFIWLCW